jgi:OmpA-OmpF porin, OOP family
MVRHLLIAVLLVGLAAASAMAQSTLHFREGQHVDPDEVASILSNAGRPVLRTRSIRLLPGDSGHGAGPVEIAATPMPSGLSLPVQFAFDSAEILPAARDQLDALAAGILRLPRERGVMIEGHTDASGTAEYNQQLSRRRAAAVRAYLVSEWGIDAPRLRIAGYGEDRPIAGSDPFEGRNRRVEFRGI